MTCRIHLVASPKRTLAAIAFVLCGALAHADDGDTLYRDATWHFQITIASGWTARPFSDEVSGLRLIVEGQPPLGKKDACYVKVDRAPELEGKAQAELDGEVRGGRFKPARPTIEGLVPLRPPYALPMANVLKEAIVALDGRAAQFIEFDFGLQGRKAQMYTLLFQAPGRIFEADCVAKSDLYPQLRPAFEHMPRSIRVLD